MQIAEKATRRHLMQLTRVVIGVTDVTLKDKQLPADGKCPNSTECEAREGISCSLSLSGSLEKENAANPSRTHVTQEINEGSREPSPWVWESLKKNLREAAKCGVHLGLLRTY